MKRSVVEATELLDEPSKPEHVTRHHIRSHKHSSLHGKRGEVARKSSKHHSKVFKNISKKHLLFGKHRRNKTHSNKH